MAKNTNRAPDITQLVKWECSCGRQLKSTLRHYELADCPGCGVIWWALQPQRGGPFQCFRWPGDWRMQQAREQREVEPEIS